MPFLWFSHRARRQAAIERLTLAAYERGLEAGKAQGFEECKVLFSTELVEVKRQLAQAEVRRQLDVRAAFSEGLSFGQAFATYEDRGWIERAAKRAS